MTSGSVEIQMLSDTQDVMRLGGGRYDPITNEISMRPLRCRASMLPSNGEITIERNDTWTQKDLLGIIFDGFECV